MLKTYRGSCHCGEVRFEAEVDLAAGTSRCNCAMCARSRFWKAIVPVDRFRLVAGSESLTTYRFGGGNISHRFCRICGIKPFGAGEFEGLGAFYAVNVACLDASDEELSTAPVTFEDGRHDNWAAEPAVVSHL